MPSDASLAHRSRQAARRLSLALPDASR